MHRRSAIVIAALLFATVAAAAPGDDARTKGQALLREGKLDDATEAFEEAIELAPDDAAAHYMLGAAYGQQAGSASMFGKMRLAGKIKDQFERAVQLAPDNVEYRQGLLQYYAMAPGVMGGGVDKAKAQAAEIAKRDAVQGEISLAVIANAEDKPDEALAHFKAAYAKRPDDSKLGVQIGIFLQGQKRYDEAFAHLASITARDPAALSAWYQIGRTSVLSKQRLADGEAALKRYLASTPGEGDPPLTAAHWRLGMIYELMQRAPDARAEYQAALKIDPDYGEAKSALAKLKG